MRGLYPEHDFKRTTREDQAQRDADEEALLPYHTSPDRPNTRRNR